MFGDNFHDNFIYSKIFTTNLLGKSSGRNICVYLLGFEPRPHSNKSTHYPLNYGGFFFFFFRLWVASYLRKSSQNIKKNRQIPCVKLRIITNAASTVYITGALHKKLNEELEVVQRLSSLNLTNMEIAANTATLVKNALQ